MVFVTPQITDNFIAYLGDVKSTSLSLLVWMIDDYTGKESIGNINVMIEEGNNSANKNIRAIKNPSGYYFFNNLPGGNYTVSIESEYYFPEKKTVDTSRIKDHDIHLEFDNLGPTAEATSIELKDASKLQIDDVVKFHNSQGDIEQRKITGIDVNTISWEIGLNHNFNEKGSIIVFLKYNILEILLKPRPSYPFADNAILVRGSVSNTRPLSDCSINVVDENITTKTDERGEFVVAFKRFVMNEENEEEKKEKKRNISMEIKKNGSTKTINTTIQEGKTTYLGIISFP